MHGGPHDGLHPWHCQAAVCTRWAVPAGQLLKSISLYHLACHKKLYIFKVCVCCLKKIHSVYRKNMSIFLLLVSLLLVSHATLASPSPSNHGPSSFPPADFGSTIATLPKL